MWKPPWGQNTRKSHILRGSIYGFTVSVEHSPIVVPSWKDVATESEFLRDLAEWDWPGELPYCLVFSYETGSDDDGVVPMASQIPMKRQREATRLVGFNNSHAGTLQDPDFIRLVRDFLQEAIEGVGAGSRND